MHHLDVHLAAILAAVTSRSVGQTRLGRRRYLERERGCSRSEYAQVLRLHFQRGHIANTVMEVQGIARWAQCCGVMRCDRTTRRLTLGEREIKGERERADECML